MTWEVINVAIENCDTVIDMLTLLSNYLSSL